MHAALVMDDQVSAASTLNTSPAPLEHLADDRPLIERIAAALRRGLGEERYLLWFEGKARLLLAGNTLVVEAPNAFACQWISSRFSAELRRAANSVLEREVELSVRAASATQASPAPLCNQVLNQDAAAIPARQARLAPIPVPPPVINARFTLDEFVVGPSNQLAYHAALRVAEYPAQQFNPLFLHGHCGLGKTHLLQGICQRFAKLHPGKKWLYLTGEQFTNDFLEALRLRKTEGFRRRIRATELLVIDDVHFLAHKKATQEEFLHTFNHVDAAGCQIVLASDCSPRQIHSLCEPLASRFVSGMVLRIDSPDLPTRLEILRRRVARSGWNVNDAVLMHIARSAASSVRELEGLLLQVIAGIHLINAGRAEAGTVLAQIKERTVMQGPVPVDRIIAAVCEHFAVSPQDLLGNLRQKRISIARAIAMHLARQHTGMSYPEIGRALGNKNHSTVIAACQRVEALIAGSELLCWSTPGGPRHQSVPDAVHDLEAAIRRAR